MSRIHETKEKLIKYTQKILEYIEEKAVYLADRTLDIYALVTLKVTEIRYRIVKLLNLNSKYYHRMQ